jgi:hypothetical protein
MNYASCPTVRVMLEILTQRTAHIWHTAKSVTSFLWCRAETSLNNASFAVLFAAAGTILSDGLASASPVGKIPGAIHDAAALPPRMRKSPSSARHRLTRNLLNRMPAVVVRINAVQAPVRRLVTPRTCKARRLCPTPSSDRRASRRGPNLALGPTIRARLAASQIPLSLIVRELGQAGPGVQQDRRHTPQ